jgi:hypothetical protein
MVASLNSTVATKTPESIQRRSFSVSVNVSMFSPDRSGPPGACAFLPDGPSLAMARRVLYLSERQRGHKKAKTSGVTQRSFARFIGDCCNEVIVEGNAMEGQVGKEVFSNDVVLFPGSFSTAKKQPGEVLSSTELKSPRVQSTNEETAFRHGGFPGNGRVVDRAQPTTSWSVTVKSSHGSTVNKNAGITRTRKGPLGRSYRRPVVVVGEKLGSDQ